MPRLYRRHPDSSDFTEPRVFARVLCDPGTIVATVDFYRSLTAAKLEMDMEIPEAGLHVVGLGPFLVLEIDRAKLDRAEQAGHTHVTVIAAHLDETVQAQLAAGATVAQARFEGPPGPGMRLRHPDGLLVEYLEHRPSRYDAESPGRDFADLA